MDNWIIFIDDTGNIIWQKTIGGDDQDYFASILQTPDQGFLVGSRTSSNFSGDKTEPIKGQNDFWIFHLDSNGILEWQKDIGGSGYDNLSSVKISRDGNIMLIGNSNSNISGDKTENIKGSYDAWIVKLSYPKYKHKITGKVFADIN